MAIITIFSATFCGEEEVAGKVADRLGYRLIGNEVLESASKRFNTPVEKLARAMHSPALIFNNFTHEKERGVTHIRAALADLIKDDNVVCHGFAAHLAPGNVSHVLRVCLVATRVFRTARAIAEGAAGSEKEALRITKDNDRDATQWVQYIHKQLPWDRNLYDVKIPMQSKKTDEAVEIICEQAGQEALKTTRSSKLAMDDFALASRVGVTLVEHGHDVSVACDDGNVIITINKNVLRLEALEKELCAIAEGVPGVKSTSAKVGPHFHEAIIYRRRNFEMPSKVLLVDDEKDFVESLSLRLQMREFGTAVASNGEEALAMVKTDEPEVMVLDLRMPGIDGIEVLRRLKAEHPDVEVIILSSLGTDKDRELAENLGAFAYLEKPVDIEKLAQTMKAAYAKAGEKKAANKETNPPIE